MLLLYSDNPSSRLAYTCKVIFENLCDVDYRLTVSLEDYSAHRGPKINYSDVELEGLQIVPCGLLGESGIGWKTPEHSVYRNFPVLFPNKGKLLPFDVLASVFYMISRYEEYQNHRGDNYGRFRPEDSIALKLNILDKACVNRWVIFLVDQLNLLFPSSIEGIKKDRAEFSIDIDNAYAYKHKSAVRTVASMITSTFKPSEFIDRLYVHAGLRPDPYDNYEFLEKAFSVINTQVKFFILCSKYGPFDKNISFKSPAFLGLIQRLKKWAAVGIHPSFASNKDKSAHMEKSILENLMQEEVSISRQHYLMFHLPETYRGLIEMGIKSDYSMGYSNAHGYRAGISVPFPFYDLEAECQTSLILHPFQFMDAMYIHHVPEGQKKAKIHVDGLLQEWNETGGGIHFVFHNEYVNNKKQGDWREFLATIISKTR